MTALMILLIGTILILGIYWQIKLFSIDIKRNNDFISCLRYMYWELNFKSAFKMIPKRNWAPMILGPVLIIGTITWGIIVLLIDQNSTADINLVLGNTGKVFLLFIIFNVKSYLGPIITCFVASVAIYNFFTYGQLNTITIIQPLIDWIFDFCPFWIKGSYWTIFLFNSLAASFMDVFYN